VSSEAYVWYWLPGTEQPVAAGQLFSTDRSQDGEQVVKFQYLPEYLGRDDAVPLVSPDLPLTEELFDPTEPKDGRNPVGLTGVLKDVAPDFWGRRVVNALHGLPEDGSLPEVEYLLAAAGTNRIGAIDVQPSREHFATHDDNVTMDELLALYSTVLSGSLIPDELLPAARCAAGVGGWRPKALLRQEDRHRIVKFAHPVDERPMVQLEAVSMMLAPYAGIPAETGIEVVDTGEHGKVMLLDRFDRIPDSLTRRQMVSLRSAIGLSELGQQRTSYAFIADSIKNGPWSDKEATLKQIFRRLVYSILVSNKDDHLKNTAAFWDGQQFTLTPAFDIAPQSRMQVNSNQFPAITRDGQKASQLRLCRMVAADFGLAPDEAEAIIAEVIDGIRTHWDEVCDRALLTKAERESMMGREFLNPYAFADEA